MEPPLRRKSSEHEQNIAKKRDALLANARGEKVELVLRAANPDPRLMGSSALQFVIAILLCLYGGMWLDAKFHTAPWLMLIGALIGASAGFYSMGHPARSRCPRTSRANAGGQGKTVKKFGRVFAGDDCGVLCRRVGITLAVPGQGWRCSFRVDECAGDSDDRPAVGVSARALDGATERDRWLVSITLAGSSWSCSGVFA